MRLSLLGLTLVVVIPLATACGGGSSGSNDGGNNGNGDGGTGNGDGGLGVDGAFPDWPLNDGGQPLCQNDAGVLVVCECSDGTDNDADGSVDAADIHCAGPFDNDEATFGTGIPGDNSDPFVQDCFFDGDSGGGNDGCRFDIRCMDTTPPFEGQHCNNNTTDGCDNCLVQTPNGCDCFGCCDVFVDGTPHRVRIVDTCTEALINDTTACPPCEFVDDCTNPCDPCEYCLGHEPDPSCTTSDGMVGPCSDGITPCVPPDNTCAGGFACVTGCCQPIIP